MPSNNMYPRDKEALYSAYKNLRKAIIKEQQNNFVISDSPNKILDHARVSDLNAYIDEQFIRLVQEYDIHSPIDFPGYIKTKLSLRTANSFVVSQKRYWHREGPSSDEGTDYSDYISANKVTKDKYFPEEGPYSFLEDMGLNPNEITDELDWQIIGYWSLGIDNDSQVAKAVKDNPKYKDISRNEIVDRCKKLKKRLQGMLKTRYPEKGVSSSNMAKLSDDELRSHEHPEREMAEFIARSYFNTTVKGKHKRNQLPTVEYINRQLLNKGFKNKEKNNEASKYVLKDLSTRINYSGTKAREIM